MSTATFFQLTGLILCGTAFATLAVELLQGVQYLRASRHQFAREQELLRVQLERARRTMAPHEGRSWDGWRKFRVKWKVRESADCHSLYLVPHDRRPLPPYRPGQYVTLRCRVPGVAESQVRCYSLSDQPRPDGYRLTVKKTIRVNGEPGRVSGYLNDVIQEGDLLDLAAPQGAFSLDLQDDRPLVLLAGGIGITPLLSMLQASIAEMPGRDTYLFYGVPNGDQHPFRTQLAKLAAEHGNLRMVTCYSRPQPSDRLHEDFDVQGRIGMELIKQHLPSNNFDFYICGPGEFTADLTEGLAAWNVPGKSIRFEAFGPATPSRKPAAGVPCDDTNVTFCRSAKQSVWTNQHSSLLDLAESMGVFIESGCRTGNCGTCATAIRAGHVQHTHQAGTALADGSCLPCIAVPNGSVELDA
jgi:ferredoxin-NADP reductase